MPYERFLYNCCCGNLSEEGITPVCCCCCCDDAVRGSRRNAPENEYAPVPVLEPKSSEKMEWEPSFLDDIECEEAGESWWKDLNIEVLVEYCREYQKTMKRVSTERRTS